MNIDLHSHFFPVEAFQKAGRYQESAPKITLKDGRCSITSGGGARGNLAQGAYDPEARIRELDKVGIDMQALSPSPILLYYWDGPDSAAYFSRLQNEAIQAVVKARPDRFVGFGTVPLQSVPEAIAIAEEAKQIGLKGLEIGTSVGARSLDAPEFEPFYEAVERLGLLLFVHPIEGSAGEREDPRGALLSNVAAFPFHTTVMIERLILSGLFEKYSNLRLCLAHGGGFLPYNIWRLDHAYHLRNDLRQSLPRRPSEYLSHFYFDSLVHSGAALQFLIDVVGAGRVVIGTDYPMGMGDMEAVARIRALSGVSPREREQILRQNALRALGYG